MNNNYMGNVNSGYQKPALVNDELLTDEESKPYKYVFIINDRKLREELDPEVLKLIKNNNEILLVSPIGHYLDAEKIWDSLENIDDNTQIILYTHGSKTEDKQNVVFSLFLEGKITDYTIVDFMSIFLCNKPYEINLHYISCFAGLITEKFEEVFNSYGSIQDSFKNITLSVYGDTNTVSQLDSNLVVKKILKHNNNSAQGKFQLAQEIKKDFLNLNIFYLQNDNFNSEKPPVTYLHFSTYITKNINIEKNFSEQIYESYVDLYYFFNQIHNMQGAENNLEPEIANECNVFAIFTQYICCMLSNFFGAENNLEPEIANEYNVFAIFTQYICCMLSNFFGAENPLNTNNIQILEHKLKLTHDQILQEIDHQNLSKALYGKILFVCLNHSLIQYKRNSDDVSALDKFINIMRLILNDAEAKVNKGMFLCYLLKDIDNNVVKKIINHKDLDIKFFNKDDLLIAFYYAYYNNLSKHKCKFLFEHIELNYQLTIDLIESFIWNNGFLNEDYYADKLDILIEFVKKHAQGEDLAQVQIMLEEFDLGPATESKVITDDVQVNNAISEFEAPRNAHAAAPQGEFNDNQEALGKDEVE